MEIQLKFNSENGVSNNHSSISECDTPNKIPAHYMPCSIDFDGEASVQSHFTTYMKAIKSSKDPEEIEELTASFRGYPLKGEKSKAPEGYSCVLLKETKTDEERILKEDERFKHFNYWNVSHRPNSGDALYQAMRWVELSKIIHDC